MKKKTAKRSARARAPRNPDCPHCLLESGLPGSTHGIPVIGDPCSYEGCAAYVVTSCLVEPGLTVVVCAEGHRMHDVEKLSQPCPQCGDVMLIESSEPGRRYVYRCRANPDHVKIDRNCAEDTEEP